MDEQRLTAAICTANALAANHRYARAVVVLESVELPAPVAGLHPDLLHVNSDLGWWMAWSGRLHAGLEVLTATAHAMSQSTGIAPLDALGVRARVAYVTGMIGEADRAAAQFDRLAAEMLDSDASTTPLGLHIRRQQARWHGTTGREQAALAVLRPLLTEMRVHLGEGHRETLLCLSNLAYYTFHAGSEAEASVLYESLVDLRTRFLGPMDPETLDARRNQAWVLGHVDPVQAMALLTRLVQDCEHVLDDDHRYLVTARLDLASLAFRTGAGDLARAQLSKATAQALASGDPVSVLSEYGRLDYPSGKLREMLLQLDENDGDLMAAITEAISRMHRG